MFQIILLTVSGSINILFSTKVHSNSNAGKSLSFEIKTAVLNRAHPQLRVIIHSWIKSLLVTKSFRWVHWVCVTSLHLTCVYLYAYCVWFYFSSFISSAPMNRKSAMTRQKRIPNCWCYFKVGIALLLEHPYSVFTTQKIPTKWSARKLQKKATTKRCWTMWCGRCVLYCWL